jgi:hypothetical protein
MAYSSGTMAGSSQPSSDFYALVAAFLATVPGWSLVETFAASSTTGFTYSIWKSAGSEPNTVATDFYVVFAYQTAAQSAGSIQFYIYLCESYNPTGHLWTFPSYHPDGGMPDLWPDATSDYRYNPTTLHRVDSQYTYQHLAALSLNSGSNLYFLVANADGFFVLVNTTSVYAGAGDTLVSPSTNDPVPLFLVEWAGARGISSTRDPGFASTNPADAPWSYDNGQIPWTNFANTVDTLGISGNYDRYQNGGRPIACRWVFGKQAVAGGSYITAGCFRALLPIWILFMQVSSIAIGDTSVIGGSDTFFYAGLNVWVDSAA